MKTFLLRKNCQLPKIGEVVKGKIFQKGRSSLLVDLGNFKMGIIYGRELQDAKESLKNLKIGDEIFAKIIELENEEGYVELSVREANEDLNWKELKMKKDKGENLVVKILGINKGGLLAKISSVPAFLPLSQLSPEHYSNVEGQDITKITKELQKLIGKELTVKISFLDYRNKTVIISEKLGKTATRMEDLKNYKLGDEVEGEITSITDFGAFVKFGPENLSGLISSSELNNNLEIGKKIKAKIIDISDDKIYLSLKTLKDDQPNDQSNVKD